MKVTITFRHMDPDDEIRDYVEKKVNKIAKKYLHRPQEAHVVLVAEKSRRMAEITMKAGNSVIVAKEETQDVKSAVDMALDKLEIQASKYRQKYKTRKKPAPQNRGFAVFRGEVDELSNEGTEPRVIKENKFVAKPMAVEDAIMILGEVKDDFMVFRNADDMKICVLYRRQDGNYGLIEQDA